MDFQKAPYTYVDRVDLYVKNVQRSKDFYTKMLGLSLLTEEANLITFTANGLSPLITIEQKDGALPLEKRSAGLYHFALLVPTRKDLAAIAAHLMKEGYPLVGGADHAVSEALYLEDPDGNGIEIYRDRSSDSWQWENGRVFMPTEALDEHLLDEWDRAPWKRIAVGTKMGHLHLQVADIKETEKFYLDGLGFDLVAQYGPWADFISTGGYHHHLGLNVWNSQGIHVPEEPHIGLNYYRLVLPGENARIQVIKKLQKLGADIEQSGNHFFTKDPSGIKLELAIS